MIRAIETVYSGYRFRSRAEARWAVFLKTLGVSFQYEAEGFDIDGAWYLPDFWVADWNSFIEVKNDKSNPLVGFYTCAKLSELSGRRVLLLNGVPPNYTMIAWDVDGEYAPARFTQCRKCTAIYIEEHDGDGGAYALEPCDLSCPNSDKWPTPGAYLTAALEAAQQARFEHGEQQ